MKGPHRYVGSELETFRYASNWKRYFAGQMRPFIRGRVLEVGAGIGGSSKFLCTDAVTHWTSLEPDPELAAVLEAARRDDPLPVSHEVVVGFLADLPDQTKFDTIVYVDVLEHIEDDAAEVAAATARLMPGGHLATPAHQFLYTPFDDHVGHFRRYSRKTIAALEASGATCVRLRYLDSVGMLVTLGNRLLLRSSTPKLKQVPFWGRCVVPVSRILDAGLFYRLGKSVMAVWRLTAKWGRSISLPTPQGHRPSLGSCLLMMSEYCWPL
ncbi:MAG: class I SAM-dependent methyltransferase [Verrucomicrobia bacterium]|nr:class I SAM-dependent methyltransferase [Verrucomicrobiota bacterium]